MFFPDIFIYNKSSANKLYLKRLSLYLKKGEKSLKDKKWSGRPITATIDENISKIKTCIKSDHYCSNDEIKAEFQISRGNIHNVIYNCSTLKNFHRDGYLKKIAKIEFAYASKICKSLKAISEDYAM